MAVLVTGAAGFIGAATSRALLERGDEVVGIDSLNDYYDPRLKQARLTGLQQQFGVEFVLPRQINNREKQIANFIRDHR